MHFENKITPFLGYHSQAEEAANFYVSILPGSRILRTVKHPSNGSVLTVEFELAGMTFVALNGGADWQFTEAMSLAVSCDSQEEIDQLWAELTADGGEPIACGWLKDKFGLRWQIVPSMIGKMIGDADHERAGRVFDAMVKMVKMDIAELQEAYNQ